MSAHLDDEVGLLNRQRPVASPVLLGAPGSRLVPLEIRAEHLLQIGKPGSLPRDRKDRPGRRHVFAHVGARRGLHFVEGIGIAADDAQQGALHVHPISLDGRGISAERSRCGDGDGRRDQGRREPRSAALCDSHGVLFRAGTSLGYLSGHQETVVVVVDFFEGEHVPEFSSHKPGTFCWPELVTTDQKGAVAFYRDVFGWDVDEQPIGPDATYSMFKMSGQNIGAAYGMDAQQRARGVPPHWVSYVSVASADEAAKRAKELGATVLMEPFDVMDVGRMAVLQDPTGAAFSGLAAEETFRRGHPGRAGGAVLDGAGDARHESRREILHVALWLDGEAHKVLSNEGTDQPGTGAPQGGMGDEAAGGNAVFRGRRGLRCAGGPRHTRGPRAWSPPPGLLSPGFSGSAASPLSGGLAGTKFAPK